MRQAAVRAFRTARLVPSRSVSLRNLGSSQSSYNVKGVRLASGKSSSPLLKSSQSVYIRKLSVAFVSGLVGYGAWHTYRGNGTDVNSAGIAQQAKDYSTSSGYSLPVAAETTAAERKAVIVGADSLYTGAIQGDGPISKDTDESGRKVLEMLTPEQATQKLRRNEESYLVGRGKGVVRYDVVQIPSNDPIEDDHSTLR